MPHPEYPDLPEVVYRVAKAIRPSEWDQRCWLNPTRWAGTVNVRRWSIERARVVLEALADPSESMILAGAKVINEIYETDTARRDAKWVWKAMIKKAPKKDDAREIDHDLPGTASPGHSHQVAVAVQPETVATPDQTPVSDER